MRKHAVKILVLCFVLGITTQASAKQLLSFHGVLDLQAESLDVNVEVSPDETIRGSFRKASDGVYDLKVDLDHVKVMNYDLSTEIQSRIEFRDTNIYSSEMIVGRIWSNYSVVDLKPVKELSGTFKIGNNHLVLNDVSFGALNTSGYIDLQAPHKLDVGINVNFMEMEDFLKFWMNTENYSSSGQVAGVIKATGTVDRLNLRGNLKSFDGRIKDMNYDSLALNIEGVYPDFQIDKSSNLSRVDGMSFSFDGPIDFADRKGFKRQLKNLNISPLVKESASQKKWTIKRHKESGADSAELKYFMRKEGSIGSQNEEEAALFGIERVLEF